MVIKVSFDFDGTLAKPKVQDYAQQLVDRGYEVHIVTSRFESRDMYTSDFCKKYGIVDLAREHKHLFEVADRIGIDPEHIHFTNMTPKSEFFKEDNSFAWHLDDDSVELDEIMRKCKMYAIQVNSNNWKKKCNAILNVAEFNHHV